MKICPTLASAVGLLGGYKVASTTGNRPLGGAVLRSSPAFTFLPSVTPIHSPRKLARGRQSIP